MDRREYAVAAAVITTVALIIQLGAVLLVSPGASGQSSNMVTQSIVEDPNNPATAVLYLVYMLIGAAVILLIRRYGLENGLQILTAVLVWDIAMIMSAVVLGLPNVLAFAVGILISALYMYHHPWYATTVISVAFGVFGTAVLGRNFGLVPVLVLLALTALYDYIAVIRTEHMQALADTVTGLDAPLPAVLIIPTNWTTLGDDINIGDDGVVGIGLGDFVIPASLSVSAAIYWTDGPVVQLGTAAIPVPALGSMVGIVFGLLAVLYVLKRTERVLPGLPFINTAAVCGFGVAALVVGL